MEAYLREQGWPIGGRLLYIVHEFRGDIEASIHDQQHRVRLLDMTLQVGCLYLR